MAPAGDDRGSSAGAARYCSYIALALALVAFILGTAPFTPALALAVIAVPLAGVAMAFGAWRVPVTALYYSLAAMAVDPVAGWSGLRIDYLLAILGVIGLILAAALYLVHARSKRSD